jgi:hypothetical protein
MFQNKSKQAHARKTMNFVIQTQERKISMDLHIIFDRAFERDSRNEKL